MVKKVLVLSKSGAVKGQAKQLKAFLNKAITIDELKLLVLAAADLHEESYVEESTRCRMFDLVHRRSQLSKHEAAELACELQKQNKGYAQVVELLLGASWNDALAWAGDYKGRKPIATIPEGFVFPDRNPSKADWLASRK